MIDKVPCNKCDAMILPSTAKRTSGVCMACKQGIRENIEKSKEYYKKQKEYDPFRELWAHLVKKVHATESGFEGLSKEEKVYFSVGILDGEVYNGGMHQFFSNSSGELYSEAVDALSLLGATNALWLLRRAAKILFDSAAPPKDRFQRWEAMKQYPEDGSAPLPEWSVELEKVNDQYWEDPDNISELLNEYAEENGLVQPFYKPNKNTQQNSPAGGPLL